MTDPIARAIRAYVHHQAEREAVRREWAEWWREPWYRRLWEWVR